MKIRLHSIKNIWLRRAAIVTTYPLIMPLAVFLMIAQATWETMWDLGFSAKRNFSEVASDLLTVHLNIADLWRSKHQKVHSERMDQ